MPKNPLSHVAPPRAPALAARLRVQREVLCRAADPNELACGCKYLEALGNIGTKTVVRATPYGYPLLLVGLSNTINANCDRKGTHCDAI